MSFPQLLIGTIGLGTWIFFIVLCLSRIGCRRVKAICIDDGEVANPNYSETKEELRRMIGGRHTHRNAQYHYCASFEWEQDGQYYQGKQPDGLGTRCKPGHEYTVLAKPGRSVITLGQIVFAAFMPIFCTIVFFVA